MFHGSALGLHWRLRLSVLLLLALCSCDDSSPHRPPPTPESDQHEAAALDVHIRTSPAGPEYVFGDRSTRDTEVLVGWITADRPGAGVCVHAPHSIDSRIIAVLVNELSGAGVDVVEFRGHP